MVGRAGIAKGRGAGPLLSGISSNNRAMAVELHFDSHGDGGAANDYDVARESG